MEMNFEMTHAVQGGSLEKLLECPDRATKQVVNMVRKFAKSKSVTVTGETGSGKEVVAGALHEVSQRKGKLVVVDCTNLNASIMGSELFGHERGAFTGAVAQHKGYFERAQGGTLFLDEIGEMPIELQPRLLRVLEANSFNRVGGTETIKSDFAIVAATNRNLEEMVGKRTLRQDLYYRLNVCHIHAASLRNRTEDIGFLADKFAKSFGTKGYTFDVETKGQLVRYAWPGNVRELRNAIERACLMAGSDGVITPADLDLAIMRSAGMPLPDEEEKILREALRSLVPLAKSTNFTEVCDRLQMLLTKDCMAGTSEFKTYGALSKFIGIDFASLFRKRKRWGLEKE